MSDWREKVQESIFADLTQPFTGKFVGGEEVETKYGACIQFTFIDEQGSDKRINTKSKRLCGLMKNIPDGTKVRILRNGEGFDTHYEVEVLAKAEAVAEVKEVVKQTVEEIQSVWDEEKGV